MRAKAHSKNRLKRMMTVPIRVLSKARELYVRSLTDAAERVSYGNTMGCPGVHISTLPKSFSVRASSSRDSEVVGTLTRSASSNTSGHRFNMKNAFMQPHRLGARASQPRMGRIDEDSPFD